MGKILRFFLFVVFAPSRLLLALSVGLLEICLILIFHLNCVLVEHTKSLLSVDFIIITIIPVPTRVP